jgi:hypothetical protein
LKSRFSIAFLLLVMVAAQLLDRRDALLRRARQPPAQVVAGLVLRSRDADGGRHAAIVAQ